MSLAEWLLLAVAAGLVGIAKTALPGAVAISVALFAGVLPTRESTAALLVLFIAGDVLALAIYRRHADWSVLLRLLAPVIIGVGIGVWFLAVFDDVVVKRLIGVALLVTVIVSVALKRGASPQLGRTSRVATSAYGVSAGFTTMVANAGGPVMSMYFLSRGFDVSTFLGTAAWFFAAVNVVKVPFAVGLGLLTPEVLSISAALVPLVLVGGLVGHLVARRVRQQIFEGLVLLFTALGGAYLLMA